ncbi:hypothetical protein GPJ56_009029 [Histomonas meleagridis]|uniref:uncharacterized protein n=1 Tax=Histomonas meleagridis TaxID=135588 RepID=UPI003559C94A|nr:hypothetical protein GPJ56_009029 [Histomonas meleagridis]KAH0799316.1 hypothetical protein GO595_008113 [Histomonas meleagridis]
MFVGIGDDPNLDDNLDLNSDHDTINPLDATIESIKQEIKAIEKEIQVQETTKQFNLEAQKEKNQKEIIGLDRQLTSLTKAVEYEEKRINKYQTNIAKIEGKTIEQQQPQTNLTDDTINSIRTQNEALSKELKELYQEIANECGDDFDIDALLKKGGSSKARQDELQALQAEYAKLQGEAIDSRKHYGIGEAADRVNKSLESLITQKATLELSNEKMKSKISKIRAKCNSLEEESHALRTMDILLTEKLSHDRELISHLEELNGEKTEKNLAEQKVPPVTEEFVEQLKSQQNIVKGLCWKLAEAQMELSEFQVSDSYSDLVDQLNQINKKCLQLQKKLLQKEAKETKNIELHIGENEE